MLQRHPSPMAGWMLATLFTLPLAGCAEDGPEGMTAAEPETFDTETVYEIVPIGGRPSPPGDPFAIFLQFDSEKAKRYLAEGLAEDARNQLVALSAEHTAQVWANNRPVHVLGGDGLIPIHSYNWDPAVAAAWYRAARQRACPSCVELRDEVRR